MNNSSVAEPAILYRKVRIPDAFISEDSDGRWGGDIRIGDLTGDGNVDFLVYKSLGGMKPSFLGAFTGEGEPIWSVGDKDFTAADADSTDTLRTHSPDRPGPVAIYDIDQDGCSEVICFLIDSDVKRTSKWNLDGIDLVILDGKTGEIKQKAAPAELRRCNAYVDDELHISNYAHQRLMLANFTGTLQPQDFVVKLGNEILAFDRELRLLWQYTNRWYRYSQHSAYIPAVGDLDGDGRDEVNGGHFGLDHDGSVLWEKYLGDNMDAVLVEEWDGDAGNGKEAILSGWGQVLDGCGNTLLKLGEALVPHGQEIRYGDVRSDSPGAELVIRYNGHHPDLMVVSNDGEVLNRFKVDDSPNNTGLEIIRWNGGNAADLIYSPAALYDGYGRKVVTFLDLPPPTGGKMGWYHCFPANVCGDEREEVILYDPCSDAVYIYTPPPFDPTAFCGYRHTPRQYNARLID
ncbi:MAG: hypothetical protein O7E52_27010 [Candidatus Poribacteria bacterium]|nr:hypothetical protein [Candidatus Poribacteria bacterium]